MVFLGLSSSFFLIGLKILSCFFRFSLAIELWAFCLFLFLLLFFGAFGSFSHWSSSIKEHSNNSFLLLRIWLLLNFFFGKLSFSNFFILEIWPFCFVLIGTNPISLISLISFMSFSFFSFVAVIFDSSTSLSLYLFPIWLFFICMVLKLSFWFEIFKILLLLILLSIFSLSSLPNELPSNSSFSKFFTNLEL